MLDARTSSDHGAYRAATAIIGGGLLILLPALYNGYPFVFPDTGTYIRQGLEFYGSLDRPPYYGLFLLLTNGSVSLWLSVLVQCLGLSALLYATCRQVVGGAISIIGFCSLMAFLSVFTALSFVSGELMPDVWSAGLVLLVFLRTTLDGKALALRAGLLVAIVATTCVHYGNLPLLAGLILVSLGLNYWRSRSFSQLLPLMINGLAAVALVVGAFIGYSVALIGEPKLSPMGSVFLSARLVADGLAKPYLEETCPVRRTPFCESLQAPGLSSDDILWSSQSYLNQYGGGFRAKERDAAELVAGTLSRNGAQVLLTSLGNAGAQLVSFRSFDPWCPSHCGEDSSVWLTIQKHYPNEFESFLSSRQMSNTLPAAFADLHVYVIWIAIGFMPIVLYWAVISRRQEFTQLLLIIWAALLGNAFVVATLSTVDNRYQSRLIWLLPMVCCFALIATIGQRRHARLRAGTATVS